MPKSGKERDKKWRAANPNSVKTNQKKQRLKTWEKRNEVLFEIKEQIIMLQE